MNSRVYFDYLDSLRFFAFLAVFIAHSGIVFPVAADWFYALYRTIISNGAYGVNFFFVLSGFLITYLLLKEKKETGKVDIAFFYIKRVLRIWPVYFVVFFVSIFILPIIVRSLGAEYVAGSGRTFVNLGMSTGEVPFWTYLFFFGNFASAYDYSPVPFALGVLWSVSVEEQFYLVWPWVVKFLKEKALFYFSGLLFFISLIYKAIHINDANIAYFSTLSVSMDLAFGCALGIVYFLHQKPIQELYLRIKTLTFARLKVRLRKTFSLKHIDSVRHHLNRIRSHHKGSDTTILILLVITVASIWIFNVLYLFNQGYGLFYETLRLSKRPVLDIIFIFILSSFVLKGLGHSRVSVDIQKRDHVKQEIGFRYKPFTYLGRISYGLYAYHMIATIFVIAVFNHFGVIPNSISVPIYLSIFTVSFALTVALSHYSYVFMEQKSISYRDRLRKLVSRKSR